MKKIRRNQDEYSKDAIDMAVVVEDMKSYFMTKPIESGFFCFRYAFQVNPYAHSAQDTERIVAKTEERQWRKFLKHQNILTYAIAFAIIAGGFGMVMYVMSQLVFA